MCCVQAVIALMEMGFDEKEVIDALRVNNNQQDAAVSGIMCRHNKELIHNVFVRLILKHKNNITNKFE